MLPYKNLIPIDRSSKQAIYLQIVEAFTQLIQNGQLVAASKLPSTRVLGNLLEVHRNTVTVVYEELEAQGWVEIRPKRGVFVHQSIPTIKTKSLDSNEVDSAKELGFELTPHPFIEPAFPMSKLPLQFNDGIPDARLAPLKALSRAYRSVLMRSTSKKALDYGEVRGVLALRESLLKYLVQTRGISMEIDNLLTTRGSMMAIYLVAQTLIKAGDRIVVGRLNYSTANMIFKHAGAELNFVEVDAHGIVVEDLEALCKKHSIRAVYVASHHHHPTTVTLCASRRIQLLKLAQQYNFAIIEDDYDYDFHYQRNPILPLASIDAWHHVIYIGSLSKVLAPAFRVGFVVAHPQLMEQMSLLRRVIDRQGDYPLEKAIADLFNEGDIQRHIRKSLRIYQERRDVLCALLEQELSAEIQFKKPNGGMAVWATFDASINLEKTAKKALKAGLFFSDGKHYTPNCPNMNATRLGFASASTEEIEQGIDVLKRSITT